MAKRISASASVVVTLRIKADGIWGSELSMEKIHQQAKESVLHKLERMAEAVKGTDIRIVKWEDIETISTEGK